MKFNDSVAYIEKKIPAEHLYWAWVSCACLPIWDMEEGTKKRDYILIGKRSKFIKRTPHCNRRIICQPYWSPVYVVNKVLRETKALRGDWTVYIELGLGDWPGINPTQQVSHLVACVLKRKKNDLSVPSVMKDAKPLPMPSIITEEELAQAGGHHG